MKRPLSILFSAVITLSCYGQSSQSFDDFRKNMLSGFGNYRDSVMTEYKEFRKRINEEYARFLREGWKEEKSEPAPKPIVEPVPKPPVVLPEEDQDKPIESNPVVIEEEIPPIPAPEPQPQPVVPIEEEPSPILLPEMFEFKYYGTPMKVRLTSKQRFKLKSTTPKDVGDAWDMLSQDEYINMLYDCLKLREEYTLCDWAYLQMLNKLSQSYLGKGTNEATFLTAFIYCQSGYRIRLGENNGKLYLLVGTPHQLYKYGYFKLDGLNFFVLNEDPAQLNVSLAVFEGEKTLSLYMPVLPKLKENLTEKRKLWSGRYQDMVIESQVNKNIIDFFNDYPTSFLGENVLTRWAMYAETPVCTPAEITAINALRPKIAGLSEVAALNKILNFVQTAFIYEYDDKVWGGDRAFFADETLYYPYCDCEDRSIIFSRFVRTLLGLKVMLVYYPGHLATAVEMKSKIDGDFILCNGHKYIVCDPTYIGAPVGMTMPDMDNLSAKVIVLN